MVFSFKLNFLNNKLIFLKFYLYHKFVYIFCYRTKMHIYTKKYIDFMIQPAIDRRVTVNVVKLSDADIEKYKK